MPSNRVELWFLLESQRLMRPVFRDFYATRDAAVADRERRMDGPAMMYRALAAAAFEAHPYRNPPNGWPGDVSGLRRADAKAFADRYYVPGNVSIAIVGDVNPAEVRKMAGQYFGPWQAKPVPGPVRTVEPTQAGPKTVALEVRPGVGRPNPPAMSLIAYKRPSQYDRDDAALDVLQVVLGHGKTGLLNKEFVTEKRLAQALQVRSAFPGGRYPSLFLFGLIAVPGHTTEEMQKALEDSLNRLKTQRIALPVIDRAKALGRVMLVNRLTTNASIANLLSSSQANYGDWRKIFALVEDYKKVTPDDLQRVMVKYFVPSGRTTVYTLPPGPLETVPAGGKVQ